MTPLASLPRHGFWIVVAIVAIALNGYTTIRYQRAQAHLQQQGRRYDSLVSRTQILTSERRGLIGLLEHVDAEAPPLQGGVLDSVGEYPAEIRSPVVVYTIAPTCPACALNIPFLNRLDSTIPGKVIGVSLASAEDTREYVRQNRINFPVVVNPSGGVMQILPRHATPVTLVVDNRRLAAFFSGVLSQSDEAFLHSAAEQARHHLVIDPKPPNQGKEGRT